MSCALQHSAGLQFSPKWPWLHVLQSDPVKPFYRDVQNQLNCKIVEFVSLVSLMR